MDFWSKFQIKTHFSSKFQKIRTRFCSECDARRRGLGSTCTDFGRHRMERWNVHFIFLQWKFSRIDISNVLVLDSFFFSNAKLPHGGFDGLSSLRNNVPRLGCGSYSGLLNSESFGFATKSQWFWTVLIDFGTLSPSKFKIWCLQTGSCKERMDSYIGLATSNSNNRKAWRRNNTLSTHCTRF